MTEEELLEQVEEIDEMLATCDGDPCTCGFHDDDDE
jgi:hypothetical protein